MSARILKFFKPHGVLSKFTDADGRPTLGDFVDVPGVWGCGRLDRDSEGLLILTDSRRLRTRLTEPRFAHPRTYLVLVERVPDDDALGQLAQGVVLKDGPSRPVKVLRLDQSPALPPRDPPVRVRKSVDDCWLELVLTEGRNPPGPEDDGGGWPPDAAAGAFGRWADHARRPRTRRVG